MYCPYCHTEYSSERPCFCQPAAELERQKIEALSHLPLQHPVAINTHNGARVD